MSPEAPTAMRLRQPRDEHLLATIAIMCTGRLFEEFQGSFGVLESYDGSYLHEPAILDAPAGHR